MKFNEVKEELLRNKKTWLITGVAGFIGSNLAEALLKLNQKVIGLDNFSTGYQHNIEDIKNNLTSEQWRSFSFTEGDIKDYETCYEITKGVDIILHQAALGSVPRSINDPITSNLSNVTGFLNMLTAAKNNGVKRFVYASSSSVYGDSMELPKVEERTGNLLSPYAVTKMTNELYGGVFYKTYGLETIGIRYFNVFGKRQNPNGAYAAVIPKWLSSLINNEDVFINGDGETSRDFTYIANVIQSNILCGTTTTKEAYGEVFNGGIGGRLTLNKLYSSISRELKENLENFVTKEPVYREFRAGDIRHSNANIDKLKKATQYEPTHDIDRGLHESIKWYIENLKQISE
ncbi:SDR family oxidoreductase [Sulfurimonas sp.]|uniref:SDR family oxidoreductase n=1 Tax=Sulfurimonas sp. TaxID=2022749 RepID=UPI0035649C3D